MNFEEWLAKVYPGFPAEGEIGRMLKEAFKAGAKAVIHQINLDEDEYEEE